MENYFLYFSSKTYVVGTQKNHLIYRLNETDWDGSFEHQRHMFKLMGKKIILRL